jgi:hypothetical protein
MMLLIPVPPEARGLLIHLSETLKLRTGVAIALLRVDAAQRQLRTFTAEMIPNGIS